MPDKFLFFLLACENMEFKLLVNNVYFYYKTEIEYRVQFNILFTRQKRNTLNTQKYFKNKFLSNPYNFFINLFAN